MLDKAPTDRSFARSSQGREVSEGGNAPLRNDASRSGSGLGPGGGRVRPLRVLAFVARSAHATVAVLPVPIAEATGVGVIEVDAEERIVSFEEKPARPRPIPGRPDHAFASMGNYLFDRDTLVETLLEDAPRSTDHDFGRTIIPELFPTGRVFAYDFQANEVPGLIVDRFNVLPRDTAIGEEPEEDARRFHVDRSGIVVIPRGGRAHTLALEDAP